MSVKEPYRTAMSITSSLLDEEDPETFSDELHYLAGLCPGFAIALLETVPRERLRWITLEQWTELLRFSPYPQAVQSIIARREMGPEEGQQTACDDPEVERGRSWIQHSLTQTPSDRRNIFRPR